MTPSTVFSFMHTILRLIYIILNAIIKKSFIFILFVIRPLLLLHFFKLNLILAVIGQVFVVA